MRRIKIDNLLERSVSKFYRQLFRSGVFSQIENDLEAFRNRLGGPVNARKREYILTLKDNLTKIATANLSEIKEWMTVFDGILDSKKINEKFHKSITKILRYPELRALPILSLYTELGVRSCIYCNAQLNVVLDVEYYKRGKMKGQVRERKALFELDHFIPKSSYPCFSITFFNLLPCCSNCNKAKSSDEALFYLYSENDELDLFNFKLDDLSVLQYWRSRNVNDLKVTFSTNLTDDSIIRNHQKLFKIEELYETQKDLIEELLHKRIVYNKVYKDYLVDAYNKKLFPDPTMINRLLIGNYDKPEDTHKRPMAKFIQDISKDLGII